MRGFKTFLLAFALAASASAHAERIKDLATVSGVRINQLVGYGLVVGLDGTGDQTTQTPFTIQSITNMLAKFGITIPANANPQLKNVAAVTVTADLPPFSKPGQTIDVTVPGGYAPGTYEVQVNTQFNGQTRFSNTLSLTLTN